MTRQHFQAIAETLRALKPDRGNKFAPRALKTRQAGAFNQWVATVHAMAVTLRRFNAGFKDSRFFAACGYEE